MFHPITRVLAAVACVPCVVLVAISLFKWDSFAGAAMYAFPAIVLGKIAVTGELNKQARLRNELYVAANKYKTGEISLDAYGEQTKRILDK